MIRKLEIIEIFKKVINFNVDFKTMDIECASTEFQEYDDYLYRGIDCYLRYSSKHVATLIKTIKSGIIKTPVSIMDIGAGVGLTTLEMAEALSDTKLYYNDVYGSKQWQFADKMFKFRGQSITDVAPDDILKVGHIDMLVMFEFCEHLLEPIQFVKSLATKTTSEYIVMANSFGAIHPEHIKEFRYNDLNIPQKAMGRVFNKAMREIGYEVHPITKTFWNRRPAIWVKMEECK